MAGTLLRLGIPFAGPGAATLPPLTTVDPIESAGSLMLVEPNHPASQWAAGVPADSTVLPNVLLPKAQGMIPAGTSTSLGALVVNSGTLAGTKGKMERTGKGGLHVILSPTVATTKSDAFIITPQQAIWDYMRANLTHVFYLSLWHRITRPGTPTSGNVMFAALNTYTRFFSSTGGTRPAVNTIGPAFRSGAQATSNTGTVGHFFGEDALFEGGNGSNQNATAGVTLGKNASHVFYRAYLEDLTVSGRDYATVDALDYALYTAQVLTPGGRYYGDTIPTDPATIP